MKYAVLTGDIVDSSNVSRLVWLTALKEALNCFGSAPTDWYIYRGDSFQLILDPLNALDAIIYIKSSIYSLGGLDVRMALGLSSVDQRMSLVAESGGPAYVYSGHSYESLDDRSLIQRSEWPQLDRTVNLIFLLMERIMSDWTVVSSKTLRQRLLHPDWTQAQLAGHLMKTQSNISRDLKRVAYDELRAVTDWYKLELKKYL